MARFESFLTGLASGLSPSIEDERKRRLEIALLSKRLEAEAAQRTAERQSKFIPFEQAEPVLRGGIPEERLSAFRGQKLSPEVFQALSQQVRPLAAIEAKSKYQVPRMRTTFQNIGGVLHKITLDPSGSILNQQALGPSNSFAKESADAIANFNSAQNQLDVIENLADRIITAQSALGLPGQAIKVKFGALTRSNPDARLFKDEIDAFLSMLTRSAGEKGVLTTQDVDRIKRALPTELDTVEIADRKMQTLRTLFESIARGRVNAFTPQIQGTNLERPKKSKKDPLGLGI